MFLWIMVNEVSNAYRITLLDKGRLPLHPQSGDQFQCFTIIRSKNCSMMTSYHATNLKLFQIYKYYRTGDILQNTKLSDKHESFRSVAMLPESYSYTY